MRTLLLSSVVAIALAMLSEAPAQAGSGHFENPSALSYYSNYAREIAAECIRNNAYGLPTNGLQLAAFCQTLGNTEALKLLHRGTSVQGSRSANPVGAQ